VSADAAGLSVDVVGLVDQARQGRPRAVARLITLVEDAHPALRAVMAALARYPGRAAVIGLTGPPGVGKSTTTSALIGSFRRRGQRVGVLAVDPSSPFSGGALLGDRIRMQDHGLDGEVFIRSMATRGHLGGLARSTPQALRVLDAAGCDVVLIETVGVGQSEIEVAALADTTVVLLAPGMGDGVQAAKAGILEVGDVFVVNKADRDGAAATARDLRQMISHGQRREPGGWRPPVVQTVAAAGTGIEAVVEALDGHRSWLIARDRPGPASDGLAGRRRRRAAAEIEAITLAELRSRIGYLRPGRRLDDLAEDVVGGRTDPYTAADTLLAALATPPGQIPESPLG
jgi:LAO/AO transport system kinase